MSAVEEFATAQADLVGEIDGHLTNHHLTWAERVLLGYFAVHPGHHKAADLSDALGRSKRECEANLRRLVREGIVGVIVEPDHEVQRFVKAYGLGNGTDLSAPIDGTLGEE